MAFTRDNGSSWKQNLAAARAAGWAIAAGQKAISGARRRLDGLANSVILAEIRCSFPC
jgi:hypothetical protein